MGIDNETYKCYLSQNEGRNATKILLFLLSARC